MAKNISVLDALAVLAESGITLGAEHEEVIRELTTATFLAAAVTILDGDETHTGKLVGDKGNDSSEQWATDLFDLAEKMRNEFTGETKKIQGGAVRMVRQIGLDTPNGHLSIMLKSE
jgi:hypothetical protein